MRRVIQGLAALATAWLLGGSVPAGAATTTAVHGGWVSLVNGVIAHMTGSTGGFAGSTGDVTFDGFDPLVTGYGGYSGRWTGP